MDEKKTKKTQQEKVESTEQVVDNEKEQLLKELEQAKSQAEDYKDKWMRNVAEFDNYKKRNAKLWQDAFNEGVANVVVKILPVGDNLDWALTLGLDEKTAEGIKNVKRKFLDTLQSFYINQICQIQSFFFFDISNSSICFCTIDNFHCILCSCNTWTKSASCHF